MKSGVFLIAVIILEAALAASSWAGPVSDYYVTSPTNIYHIKGNSIVSSWATVQGSEFPIVVLSNTVQTGSYYSAVSGHEYTLNGTYTGTSFPPTIPGLHHDGATDGRRNYTTSYWSDEVGTVGRAIWRTDINWTNPVMLFNTVSTRPSGIAYDSSNRTLWVSEWDGEPSIRNYSMTGTVLSSFATGVYASALAFDPLDNTLWMGGYDNPGNIYQYSRTGTYLGSTYFAQLSGTTILGGEINPIPEPGTYAMLLAGIGLVGLAVRSKMANE